VVSAISANARWNAWCVTARAWAIAGGTVEVQLNNIASGLFGRRFNQRPRWRRVGAGNTGIRKTKGG
jgi:hypothetical protein